MKTHVDFAHPKLFVKNKVQVVEKLIAVDVNHSQQHGKKRVGYLILQLPNILGPQTFTKRMMRCSRCFLRICFFTFA
jgi:hypothetical protein